MSSSSSQGLQVSTATGTFGTLPLTNLGPITTTWSAPSSCYQTTTANTLVYESVTQNVLYVYDVLKEDNGQCNPPVAGDVFTATSIICDANNCLRAMIREGSTGATPFCASYTIGTVTQTAGLPTWATQCTANPTSQVSSACSCLPYIYSDGSSVAATPTLTLSASYAGFSNLMYYSPAICPEGWATAATFTDFWGLTFSAVTSAYMCCPSGFTSDSDFSAGMMCATAVSKGATITNLVQGGAFTPISNLVLQSDSKVLAGGLRILYQASDSAALAAAGGTVGIEQPSSKIGNSKIETTTVTTAISTSTIVSVETNGGSVVTKTVGQSTVFSTTTGTITSSPTSSSGSSTSGNPAASAGLSTGAKAGIAVGVVGLVLAVLLLTFFFFRRRGEKQQQRKKEVQQQEEGITAGRSVEGAGEDIEEDKHGRAPIIQSQDQSFEMGTPVNAHEMQTKANTPEVDNSSRVHELDNGLGGDLHNAPFYETGATVSSPRELDQAYVAPWHKSGERTPSELDARPRLPSLHGPELGLGYSPEPERQNSRPRMASMESLATVSTVGSSPRPGETGVEKDKRKQLLKEKMARIKEEKDRLQRLQELTSLEEETLRELNEEEQRGGSRGS